MDKRKIFNEMLLEAIEEGAPVASVVFDDENGTHTVTVQLRLWSPLEGLVLSVTRIFNLKLVAQESFFSNFLYDLRYWSGRLKAQVKSPSAHYIEKDEA